MCRFYSARSALVFRDYHVSLSERKKPHKLALSDKGRLFGLIFPVAFKDVSVILFYMHLTSSAVFSSKFWQMMF